MRISTNMIFDSGVSSMQKRTTDLLNIQQQLSSGRRMLTPADDPVAAAQALEVSQSKDMNAQYLSNQKNAKDTLSLAASQLQSADNIMQRVRQLTVQLGNAALSDGDRASIASELRQNFDELMGIANQRDATGNYLFSGFRGNTQPFTGSADLGVVYNGDTGQRQLQVTGARSLPVSDSGQSIFLLGKDASVPFVAAADPLNKGLASIGQATVTDQNKWNAASNGKNYSIKFAVVGTATTYDIVDDKGISLLTNAAASNTPPLPGSYQNGTPIPLKSLVVGGQDLGASVTINGSPLNGDTFTIRPSAPASIFDTMASLVHAAETPLIGGQTAAGNSALSKTVAATLANIDSTHSNILSVEANVGARINELSSLETANGQVDLSYQDTLSRLQDVDYTAAITNLNKNQINLQAAQQSFTKVSQLSLFNYL